MILQLLLTVVFGIVNVILAPFLLLDLVINTNIFNTIMEYLNVVFYVLPIENFIPIIVFLIATMGMRIVISLVRTLWQMLPFL